METETREHEMSLVKVIGGLHVHYIFLLFNCGVCSNCGNKNAANGYYTFTMIEPGLIFLWGSAGRAVMVQ